MRTDWLERAAASEPNAEALRDRAGERLSYAELLRRARRIAAGLSAATDPDALCLLDLPPGLDHAAAMHGAMLAGRPFQTARPGLPAAERRRALPAGRESLTIDAETLRELEGSPADRRFDPPPPERTLCRVLTSGTSGEPRAVELSWANHRASAVASASLLPLARGDRWLCCLPLDHVGGLSILLRSVLAGSAALIHDRFRVDDVAAAVEDCELVSLVPTQLRRLLEVGAPLETPRAILLGGAPASGELLAKARDRGCRLFPTYGMTEASSQVCTLPPDQAGARPGSVGRPLPGVELDIDAGEIVLRGPMVAAGALSADGWLHSGDLGRRDADGFVWVEGRADDLIVSGGENVRPEEVEAALLEHPLVGDAAVAGRPDPEWGQRVCAWVVPDGSDGLTEPELIEHCRARLAPAKVPKRIELVGELPRSGSGKLLRRRLG